MMKEDWVETALIDVCEVLDNLRKPINSSERKKRIEGKVESELYPYYGATGQVGFIDDFLTDGDYVLIGEDAAPFLDCTKNVAYKISGKTWVNNHAHILKSLLNNDFLLHFLNQFQYKNYVTGTTRLKLTQGALKRMPVWVAPLPIQRAIVSKIETLFSDLDKGIADLKKAQEQLKIYRQAVLKKAFEGELTREWREQQTDLPTAEELLEQIKKERQKHYEQQLEEWKQAVKDWEENGEERKRPGKPEQILKIRNTNNKEAMTFDNLPRQWLWLNLEAISEHITDGDHQAPPKSNEGIPFITISNINKVQKKIDFTNTFHVKSSYFKNLNTKRVPRKGDILYTVTGSFGIPVIIDFEKDFCFQRHIGLIRLSSGINQKWVFNLLQAQLIYRQASEKATGTAQKTVALSTLRNIQLPFCSIQEQHQIVREIESRLSVCEKVEQNITEALETSEALRQSILKKAFEGKLLSPAEIDACRREADYEPADVLLERIRKERPSGK